MFKYKITFSNDFHPGIVEIIKRIIRIYTFFIISTIPARESLKNVILYLKFSLRT